ncbi:unnamed protein product [Ixodes pacificus]
MGCSVLLRVDLNVPVLGGVIQSKTRIERVAPTVRFLLSMMAKVIVVSHLGRPVGYNEAFSLRVLIDTLSESWGTKVTFVEEVVGEKVKCVVDSLPPGSVVVLENLRFYKGEVENDMQFAKQLASVADVYVNDAFSCSHRKHASVCAVTEFLPSFAGLELQKELQYLDSVVNDAPAAAVIGGAKVLTKIPMLQNLAKKVDFLILGGVVSHSFLSVVGCNVGGSLCEQCGAVGEVFSIAQEYGCRVVLPKDHVVARSVNDSGQLKDNVQVKSEDMILDIGHGTLQEIENILGTCRTIFWNGPMGAFEYSGFSSGTSGLVRSLVFLREKKGVSTIVGGGDSIFAIQSAGYSETDFSHVSTGGGALLHFLGLE